MLIARLRHKGNVWLARVEDDTAALLVRESDHPAGDALREALADPDALAGKPHSSITLDEAVLLAPVGRPSKILAIGLNYGDHARESGAEIPPAPLVFAKAPTSIIGPNELIRWRSADSTQVDYEAELAVVIGARAAGDLEDPMNHVFGYTVGNDVSARDAQFSDGQWVRGKSFDTFCPLGPWIATRDEITDCQSLGIGTRINDLDYQKSTTAEMIFPVADLVAYLARFMTLEPGDVILTGTPWGVGFVRTPPVFLRDGDTVVCWVEGIGELRNIVKTG